MTTALFVIDVQQSFLHRPYFQASGLAQYLEAQNRLIAGALRAGWPVVRVLHEETEAPESGSASGLASNPFHPASGLVRPMEGLMDFDAALSVRKQRHSALVGTGAGVWLVRQGIRRIVVSGIRTEQCCETTARHASDLGWEVVFAAEATMTWDIRMPDGTVFDTAAIRQRTAAVLHGRFATVGTVAEVLA